MCTKEEKHKEIIRILDEGLLGGYWELFDYLSSTDDEREMILEYWVDAQTLYDDPSKVTFGKSEDSINTIKSILKEIAKTEKDNEAGSDYKTVLEKELQNALKYLYYMMKVNENKRVKKTKPDENKEEIDLHFQNHYLVITDDETEPLLHELDKAEDGLSPIKLFRDESEEWILIEFENTQQARDFLEIVAYWEEDFSDMDSFYNMVNNTWKPTNDRLSENIWRYSVRPIDNNLKWVEKEEKDYSTTLKPTHNGWVDFDFCISIYFPEKNLPIIIERLKTYNEGDD